MSFACQLRQVQISEEILERLKGVTDKNVELEEFLKSKAPYTIDKDTKVCRTYQYLTVESLYFFFRSMPVPLQRISSFKRAA